jgi:MFS family permease
LATALLLSGNGVVTTVLPLRWFAEGVPADIIADIGSANWLGMVVGAVCGADVVRRLGIRMSGLVCAALFAASTLATLAVTSPTTYALARFAGGSGLAGLFLVIETGLNVRARPERRSGLMAWYMVVFYLAQAAGAASSAMMDDRWLVAAASILILLSALLLPWDATEIPATSGNLEAVWQVWRLAPGAGIGALAAGALLGTFYALGPVYFAVTANPGSGGVGWYMAITMVGGVMAMAPIAAAADRQGRLPWLVAVNAAVAIVSAWLGFAVGQDGSGLSVAAFAFGAVGFACYPLASASVNQAVPHHLRLSANGLVVLLAALGGCVGPLVAGALVPRHGAAAAFAVIGTTGVLAAAGICATARRRMSRGRSGRC